VLKNRLHTWWVAITPLHNSRIDSLGLVYNGHGRRCSRCTPTPCDALDSPEELVARTSCKLRFHHEAFDGLLVIIKDMTQDEVNTSAPHSRIPVQESYLTMAYARMPRHDPGEVKDVCSDEVSWEPCLYFARL
jgi:hypothetical protein